MSITFVNSRPRAGSYENPFQLPPPSVLGNVTIVASTSAGVRTPFVYSWLLSHRSLQNAA